MNGANRARIGALVLCLASQAGEAATRNLLVETVPKSGACFTRSYDGAHLRAHEGQTVTSIRVSLRYELPGEPSDTRDLRIELRQKDQTQPFYVVGGCYWGEDVNRDVEGRRLIGAFRKNAGVQCSARGGIGGSAEEGGDFPIDIAAGGASLTLYMDSGVSGWRGPDQKKKSTYLEFGEEDRIFRLDRVDVAACADLDRAVAVD